MAIKSLELKKVLETFTNIIKLDKIRPVTDLVEIYSKDGYLHLGSTDNRTTIVAKIENDNEIDNAVLCLSNFCKIVKLTTKEEIILSHKGKYIEFKGNGKYKIPIQTDEMGNDISLPLDMPDIGSNKESFQPNDFKRALERNKVGVYKGDGHGELKLYYSNNGNLITTDSIVAVNTNNCVLPKGDIQAFIIEQLSSLPEDMTLYYVDDGYVVETATYKVFLANKLYDKFPYDMVAPFIDKNIFCGKEFEINKKEFIEAIKRQDVFKSILDIPSVIIEAKDNQLCIKNVNGTVEEPIEVHTMASVNISLKISTEILLGVLKNMNENITIHFAENILGLSDEDGLYVISAMEE